VRVLILTFGTLGDVRPFVALAKGLRAAGHEAGVCTAEGFRSLVVRAGVDYVHMGNEMLDLVQSEMPRMGGAPHVLTPGAPVAAHRHFQRGRLPPERLVRQPTDHGFTR
jgi:hypothetical protein